jgi:RNase adapter protein RapZ
VAIGCTGGQHRSVYLVERLAQAFSPRYQVLVRHRELAPADAPSADVAVPPTARA